MFSVWFDRRQSITEVCQENESVFERREIQRTKMPCFWSGQFDLKWSSCWMLRFCPAWWQFAVQIIWDFARFAQTRSMNWCGVWTLKALRRFVDFWWKFEGVRKWVNYLVLKIGPIWKSLRLQLLCLNQFLEFKKVRRSFVQLCKK